MVMSVDQMILVAQRQPKSLRFRAVEVTVVGFPRKTWNESVKKDIFERGVSDADPQARLVWMSCPVNNSQLLRTPDMG